MKHKVFIPKPCKSKEVSRVRTIELSSYITQTRLIGTHSGAAGVGNKTSVKKHTKLVGDPTFWQKCINQHLRQVIVEFHPWRFLMVG